MSSTKRLVAPSLLALVVCSLIAVACANSVDMGVVKPEVDGSVQQFTPPPGVDSGDAADVVIRELACIGTECPAPWTTCLSASGPTYKCGTDLSRDAKNCGACGNECLAYKPIHMTSRCIESACALECYNEPASFGSSDWRNCNGRVDDGCEIDVFSDPKNCGTCGNACAPGTACVEGKCGCPNGQIFCGEFCVDPQKDDNNCGGCGVVCKTPAGACKPTPAHARYGCFKGTCGHLMCQNGAADCNGDLLSAACSGDGCEVANLTTDRNNCGGCGVTCVGAEECVDEGNGYTCAVPCKKFGKSLCPGGGCYDLLNDPGNCGSCGAGCQRPGPNQASICKKGLCGFECAPGFGDCNGDPLDGCETNLRTHPANCGSCGVTCDVAGGQPCIEGRCLMTTCEAGVAR